MVPLLRSIEARAAGGAAPLRLLIIQHPLGTNPGLTNWRPAATATTSQFTLPMESAPFAPLQQYMVMVDGVNLITAGTTNDQDGGQNTHEGGFCAMMTGVPTLGMVGQQDHCAGGPSIDQILLQQAPGLGGPTFPNPTPFGSLQLAADIRSDRDEVGPRVLSYLAPIAGPSDPSLARQPLYPETSPLNVYNRLFGGALPSGSNSAQLLAQKLSVITYLQSDLARLKTLVPASEKDRLDAHAGAIAALEATLQTTYGPPTPPANAVCVTPATPADYPDTIPPATPPATGIVNLGYSGNQEYDNNSTVYTDLGGVDYYVPDEPTSHPYVDLGQTQLRLIKTAFACDLVRVATFMWSAGSSWVGFPGTFQGATIAGNLVSAPHNPPSHTDPSTDPDTPAWLNQINQFYSASTAAVLQEFATTPDIDGNMLIDNTIIVYLTEVARAWDHNQQNMPLILFGGKNTRLNGGTFLKVTGGALPAQTGGTGNRPFNDVWLALAPIFGVTMTSLGSPSQYTGPLAGIFT